MDQQEIEARVARALEMHEREFNCAQCVACACADAVGLDETIAFRMMEGFGGGMGRHTETCGAVSGGAAILGFSQSKGPQSPTTKEGTYEQVYRLVERFRAQNGSTVCADLKGETGKIPKYPCDDCIADGVRMTLELLS